jgi:F0F1-type ATP synthase epsilon subunit
MRLAILEPKGEIWQGMVKEVKLPAQEGQMSVLDFHQAFVVRLQKGNIVFSNKRIAVKDGIAFMRSNILTVFAQT